MKKVLLFVAILSSVVVLCSSGKVRKAGSDPVNSLVGYTQADFPVGMGLYTAGNRQYVAFYDSVKMLTLAQRELPDGAWKYKCLDVTNPWDSHNYITMIMDSRGVLHISGNMHVAGLQYWCTDKSGDISTVKRVYSLVGRDEDRMTYPRFIKMQDGGLLFHYRLGSSGNGIEIYDRMDHKGNWSRWLETPLTDGLGAMNAYMTEPRLRGGYYHMIWVWRDDYDCATNHDLSYARSKDLRNWEDASGKPVRLPMTIADKQLIVDPVPVGGGLLNGGSVLGIDAQGRPMIAYHKYDGQDKTQIYLARFENGAWVVRKITEWDLGWHFSGGGSIIRELRINSVSASKNGKVMLAYSRFDPETNKHWSRRMTLDPDSLKLLKEEDNNPHFWPSWIDEVKSTFSPKMESHVAADMAGGREWILRWESMPNNRDMPFEGPPFPPASELRVIKVR